MFSKHPTHISPSNCSSTNRPMRSGRSCWGILRTQPSNLPPYALPLEQLPNKACQQGAIDTRLPLNKMIQNDTNEYISCWMNYISNIYRTISNICIYKYIHTYVLTECNSVIWWVWSVLQLQRPKKLSKLVIRPPLWLPECLLHLFRCPMCQLDLDHTNVIHISPIASRRLGKSNTFSCYDISSFIFLQNLTV